MDRKNSPTFKRWPRRRAQSRLLVKEREHQAPYEVLFPKAVQMVYQPEKGMSVFAARAFRKGEKILPLTVDVIVSGSKAGPFTLQIDQDLFLDSPTYLAEDFVSHSCQPNTFVDFSRPGFIAIRNIKKNEEIAFHYCTTEWDLKRWRLDFRCACESPRCLKHISGFRYLTRAQKASLRPYLSPFLQRKFDS